MLSRGIQTGNVLRWEKASEEERGSNDLGKSRRILGRSSGKGMGFI